LGSNARLLVVALAMLTLALSTFALHPVSGSATSPDFSISASNATATAYQGQSGLADFVYVYSNAYFSGWVNMTIGISPSLSDGPRISLSPADIYMDPSLTRTPTIYTATLMQTPLETFNVTITAHGLNLTRTTSYNLTVIPPTPPPDFTVAVWPSSASLMPGDAEGVTLALYRVNQNDITEFTLLTSLTVIPHDGLEVSGLPGPTLIPYNAGGVLPSFIIAAGKLAPAGTYTLNATVEEPPLSESPTGWKPAVYHSSTATIHVGSPTTCCTSQPAPLVYDLEFTGSPSPGQTIKVVNQFSNQSPYPATITRLSVVTDLASRDLAANLSLPVTVPAHATLDLSAGLTIAPNTSLGPHPMNVVVYWTSTDPMFNSISSSARSPITYQKDLMVTNQTALPPQGPFGFQLLNPGSPMFYAVVAGAALAGALATLFAVKKKRALRISQGGNDARWQFRR
jgi:hypothetical protein